MKSLRTLLFVFLLFNFCTALSQSHEIEVGQMIYNHYEFEEIEALKKENPVKLKKLDYYFQDSYYIVPSDLPEAEPITIYQIDIKRFENQRLETERNEIIISRYDDKLILKSKKEVEDEYKKIEDEHHKNSGIKN